MQHSPLIEQYQKIVDSIADSLDFFERVSGGRAPHEVTAVDFFAAHEGLLMHYEQAQTRYIERQKRWYNLSTHMPWIGMRTAQLDGAHVEFFRGISNPMGVKIGPAMTAEWLQGLVTTLNPQQHAGAPHHHPSLRREGRGEGPAQDDQGGARNRPAGAVGLRPHARQHRDQLGRTQDAALREHPQRELELSFQVHEANGSFLGGVHIELTGEDVTECTGGARGLTDADLARAYKSTVDPRLNYEQALEMAMLIGRHGRHVSADACSTSTSRFPKTASASPSIRTRRSMFRTIPSSLSSKATASASTSRR